MRGVDSRMFGYIALSYTRFLEASEIPDSGSVMLTNFRFRGLNYA